MGPDARQDEDCLFLDVWAPSTTSPGDNKPVMVWVHGGAYMFGSSSQPLCDGRATVTGGDVVLVTINYRLGALGFVDLSSLRSGGQRFDSNPALRDVLSALQWVRQNITSFGGDPDRVIDILCAVPRASG